MKQTGWAIAQMVKDLLEEGYDAIWHKAGGGNYHLHVEWDPK